MTEHIVIGGDETLHDGKYLRMIRRNYIGSLGEKAYWEMVQRKNTNRIVAVAAITPERELVLEKIFRVPLGSYVIELPTGLADIMGESEEDAARRELLEETGFTVDEMKILLRGPFNVGLIEDEMALYYGTNARKIQEPQLENSEDIEVVRIPLQDVSRFLQREEGIKKDLKIAAVLPYLK